MSSSSASLTMKAWDKKSGNDFASQIISLQPSLMRPYMDKEYHFEIFVGKGGRDSQVYHHYIVLRASVQVLENFPPKECWITLILELSKSKNDDNEDMVAPNVRWYDDSIQTHRYATGTYTLRYRM